MGDRDAGIGKAADAGGDARYHAERNARLDQRQGFLAAAAEHEGVAALEAQDPVALARQRDQPERDVALVRRRLAAALAGIFNHGAGLDPFKDALIHQGVIDHHIRLPQPFGCKQCQQARIAGAGTGQPDPARLEGEQGFGGQIVVRSVHGGTIQRPVCFAKHGCDMGARQNGLLMHVCHELT